MCVGGGGGGAGAGWGIIFVLLQCVFVFSISNNLLFKRCSVTTDQLHLSAFIYFYFRTSTLEKKSLDVFKDKESNRFSHLRGNKKMDIIIHKVKED